MANHFAKQPLPASFMASSMIGLVVTLFVIWPWDQTWGFTLSILFGIWFIASVINFTHAEGEEHLDVHNSRKYLD